MDELPGILRTVKGLLLAGLLLAAVSFGAGFGTAYWWQVLPARAEAANLKADLDTCRASLSARAGELATAEADVANLTAQVEDGQTKLADAERESLSLVADLDEVKTRLVTCQDGAKTETDGLRARLAEAQAQAAASKDRAEASADRVTDLQAELETCRADAEATNDETADLSLRVASLRAELETCQADAALEAESQFYRGVFMFCQYLAALTGGPLPCMAMAERAGEEGWYPVPMPDWRWPPSEQLLPESPAPSRGGA